MIVRWVKCSQSISGKNTQGAASASHTVTCILLSTVICITCPQWLHTVCTSTMRYSLRSFPSTKGAAMASSAQAPYKRSPVLKFKRCGVGSTVTG
jgi:hypothetical protein